MTISFIKSICNFVVFDDWPILFMVITGSQITNICWFSYDSEEFITRAEFQIWQLFCTEWSPNCHITYFLWHWKKFWKQKKMSKFVHKIWLHFSEHTEKTFFRIHYLAIQVIRNVNYLTLLRSLLILQNVVLSWKNFWKTERQILFSFFKQKETTL